MKFKLVLGCVDCGEMVDSCLVEPGDGIDGGGRVNFMPDLRTGGHMCRVRPPELITELTKELRAVSEFGNVLKRGQPKHKRLPQRKGPAEYDCPKCGEHIVGDLAVVSHGIMGCAKDRSERG